VDATAIAIADALANPTRSATDNTMADAKTTATLSPQTGTATGITAGTADDKKDGFTAQFKALPRPAKIAIISGVVILSILITLGITLLVNHALNLAPVREAPRDERPVEPSPPVVKSIEITDNGIPVSDKELKFGESVTFLIKFEPEGIDEEVIWSYRTEEIIKLEYVNTNKTIVHITGIGQGTTRLTASVGGVEAVCIIRVGEEPAPKAEAVTIMLEGNPVSKAEIFVNDNIVLQIKVEPEGVVDEIVLSNNNPDLIEVTPSNSGKTEIMVTGKSPGTAVFAVTVGEVSAQCVFDVKPDIIEVPHPFAAALPQFFAGAALSTVAYIANVPGMDEPVVLAGKDYAHHRVLYINNGNLRTFDFEAFEGSAFTSNNHIVGFWPGDLDMKLSIYSFAANEINPNPIILNITFDEARQTPVSFYHNGREITKAVFDAYLEQFGLYRFFYNNESLERPDDTAKILAMTAMVEAPR